MPVWLMALEAGLSVLTSLMPTIQTVVNAIDSSHPSAAPAQAAVNSMATTIAKFSQAITAAKP